MVSTLFRQLLRPLQRIKGPKFFLQRFCGPPPVLYRSHVADMASFFANDMAGLANLIIYNTDIQPKWQYEECDEMNQGRRRKMLQRKKVVRCRMLALTVAITQHRPTLRNMACTAASNLSLLVPSSPRRTCVVCSVL